MPKKLLSPARPLWTDIVRPATVTLITGYKGKGKSALAYYLVENVASTFHLRPIIVELPVRGLVPADYLITTLDEALTVNDAVVLVDEGTTKLPAGRAMDEFIKACSSLSRQRNQVLIFVFHTSRDVGSKALRGIDAVVCKQPSGRQIRYGSKDPWFRSLMEEAMAAFKTIPEGERTKFAYVDSEDPDYRGMMANGLPTFWSEELSTAWANQEGSLASNVISQLEVQSNVVRGEGLTCCICKKPTDKLVSDTCEACFNQWATSAKRATAGSARGK